MIKFLRNKKVKKHVMTSLAVVIILPLGMWTVMSRDKSESGNSALAFLDGKRISVKDYLASYDAVKRQAELLYGGRAKDLEGYFDFKGDAFDRILFLDYAKKEHLKVTDDEVVNWISTCPAFGGRERFDERIYKGILGRMRILPRAFEEEVRQSLLIQKIAEKLKSKIKVTDEELKDLYNRENGERDIEYAILAAGPASDKAVIKEDELKSVYASLKNQLVSQSRVTFDYLFVPKDSPLAAKGIFDEKNLPLADLAKKYGLQVKTLEYPLKDAASKETLPEAIISQGFSAALGEDSDWVRLEAGAYKFNVTDRKKGSPLTFESAKPLLSEMLAKQKASESAVKKLEDLRKKMTPENFEASVKAAGMEIKHFDKYKKGASVPGLENSRTAERQIAKLKSGDLSPAFRISGGAAVVKILRDSLLDVEKFNAEKSAFKDQVISQKTHEAMQDLLDNLRTKLKLNVEVMNRIFAPQNDNG